MINVNADEPTHRKERDNQMETATLIFEGVTISESIAYEGLCFFNSSYYYKSGNFKTKLWDLISVSDVDNKKKLSYSFPQEVACYKLIATVSGGEQQVKDFLGVEVIDQSLYHNRN